MWARGLLAEIQRSITGRVKGTRFSELQLLILDREPRVAGFWQPLAPSPVKASAQTCGPSSSRGHSTAALEDPSVPLAESSW